MATGNDNKLDYTVRVKAEGLEKLGRTLETTEDATKDLGAAATTAGAGLDKLTRIFHRSRATNEYGIALVCPKIQVSNLDQRAGNAEAKLYRRN